MGGIFLFLCLLVFSRGSSIVESDITECSTTSMNSVYITSSFENDERPMMDQGFLESKSMFMLCTLNNKVALAIEG